MGIATWRHPEDSAALRIGQVPVDEWIAAKNFIDSLVYEMRFEPAEQTSQTAHQNAPAPR